MCKNFIDFKKKINQNVIQREFHSIDEFLVTFEMKQKNYKMIFKYYQNIIDEYKRHD